MVYPLKAKDRGHTLVEVLLAFAILAVAILGVAALIGSGLRLQAQSDRVSAATEVGRTFLEQVRSRGFSAIPDADALFDGRVPTAPEPITGFPPAPYPSVMADGRLLHLLVEVRSHGPGRRSVFVQVYWDRDSRIALENSFVP